MLYNIYAYLSNNHSCMKPLSLGLRGHLITNFPQIMRLLIIIQEWSLLDFLGETFRSDQAIFSKNIKLAGLVTFSPVITLNSTDPSRELIELCTEI